MLSGWEISRSGRSWVRDEYDENVVYEILKELILKDMYNRSRGYSLRKSKEEQGEMTGD